MTGVGRVPKKAVPLRLPGTTVFAIFRIDLNIGPDVNHEDKV